MLLAIHKLGVNITTTIKAKVQGYNFKVGVWFCKWTYQYLESLEELIELDLMQTLSGLAGIKYSFRCQT